MYLRHTFMLYLNKIFGQNLNCPSKYRKVYRIAENVTNNKLYIKQEDKRNWRNYFE